MDPIGHTENTVPPSTDPVTRFLTARGLAPRTAYLGESEFELGLRIEWDALDLTYRYEDGTLLLCDVAAAQGSDDVAGAIRRLVSLIHALEREVPEVVAVHGLVPVDEGRDGGGDGADDGGPDSERLLAVYRRLGADCRPDAGSPMMAVTYAMRQSRRGE